MTTIKVYGKIRSSSFSGNYIRLVQDERSKCLHDVLVYGSTAVIKTTTLCRNEIVLRFDEVF